jgi:hypothetical protein
MPGSSLIQQGKQSRREANVQTMVAGPAARVSGVFYNMRISVSIQALTAAWAVALHILSAILPFLDMFAVSFFVNTIAAVDQSDTH